VTREMPDAHVSIRGAAVAGDDRVSLSPRETWRWEGDVASTTTPLRFEVTDASGGVILSHTENQFDRTPAAAVQVGPQPTPRIPRGVLSVDDVLQRGEIDELEGRRQLAMTR